MNEEREFEEFDMSDIEEDFEQVMKSLGNELDEDNEMQKYKLSATEEHNDEEDELE